MSKLLTLKEWLNVPEVARHLSRIFNEEVGEADVLRFALDGRLKLSVHFVNNAYANPGKFCRTDDIEWYESPIGKKENAFESKIPKGICVGDDQWVVLEDKVVTLTGVWDLPLIGADRLDVEHEYQRLIDGPKVSLLNLDGAFVCDEANGVYRLCDPIDENEFVEGSSAYMRRVANEIINAMTAEEAAELRVMASSKREDFLRKSASLKSVDKFYPAGGIPRDGVLVVRSRCLADFVASVTDSKVGVSEDRLSTKERNSLLKIVLALSSLANLKGDTYKRAETIANAAKDVGVSISVNTVDKFLKEASSIEK
ncbi:hypothetical protein [Burkholderia gladioli]|uniref:hypothetical protein n=1 Tax=Burkholderia gladioli TaxID=28095 RepID=UPI000F53D1BC|nr:hypothetical protein [Burkholderia gladioli]MBU9272705.1 hypothetical protein [Burkholderia gladioli]